MVIFKRSLENQMR